MEKTDLEYGDLSFVEVMKANAKKKCVILENPTNSMLGLLEFFKNEIYDLDSVKALYISPKCGFEWIGLDRMNPEIGYAGSNAYHMSVLGYRTIIHSSFESNEMMALLGSDNAILFSLKNNKE